MMPDGARVERVTDDGKLLGFRIAYGVGTSLSRQRQRLGQCVRCKSMPVRHDMSGLALCEKCNLEYSSQKHRKSPPPSMAREKRGDVAQAPVVLTQAQRNGTTERKRQRLSPEDVERNRQSLESAREWCRQRVAQGLPASYSNEELLAMFNEGRPLQFDQSRRLFKAGLITNEQRLENQREMKRWLLARIAQRAGKPATAPAKREIAILSPSVAPSHTRKSGQQITMSVDMPMSNWRVLADVIELIQSYNVPFHDLLSLVQKGLENVTRPAAPHASNDLSEQLRQSLGGTE